MLSTALPAEPSGIHRRLAWRVMFLLLAVWLAACLWLSRDHYLDDTLIGLRYATHFAHSGYSTYDGAGRNSGSSSPLYVVILSAAQLIHPNLYNPKIVNDILFLFLILFAAAWITRSSAGPQRWWWLALLLTLAGPMGIRWLTDGMETGLVALLAVLFSYRTLSAESRPAAWLMMPFCMLAVFTRVEFAYLGAAAVLALVALAVLGSAGSTQAGQHLVTAASLALGTIAGVLLLRLYWGAFLPDTAVAKSSGPSAAAVLVIPRSIIAAGSLGLGIVALWLCTVFFLLFRQKDARARICAWANLAIPLLFLMIGIRGQKIEGIRHLLWAFVFLGAWNLVLLARHHPASSSLLSKRLAQFVCLMLVACYAMEARTVLRIVAGRSESLRRMHRDNLGALRDQTGMANDIGFIGYFSGASFCDLGGLVNGTKFAMMTPEERLAACAARQPAFAFLDADQKRAVAKVIPIDDWAACAAYDFPNANTHDVHYLLLAPRLSSICDGLRSRPAGQ